jgi:4-hydroxybenzoate polyprenyltransferase and related prenyltransferases
LRSLIKLFRIHQWSKNVLIFFPLIAAPQFFNFENMGMLVLAFFVFGICASSTYIINDILDIENDRLHKTKKFRPFAAGTIPAIFSLSALIILPISIFFAGFISINFMLLIMMYILITLSYSIYLKTLPIIDCLVLASLYTIRIVGGALVISSTLSFWLLGFSLMFFFSLSLLKRYAEIPFSDKPNQEILFGRGNEIRDYPLILNMGVSSATAQ